jgi:hypothetical protein
LDAPGAAASANVDAYELHVSEEGRTRLNGVPLPVSATKSLLARWTSSEEFPDRAELVMDQDGLLRGEVVNPLAVELSDCTVFFENWVYRLDSRRGTLRPGERTRVEVERALNLQWRLTGRRVVEKSDLSTPWDQNTLDIHKILEMMMLHEAAGGESYTKLANRYQAYVDLSRHVRGGRAILFGRCRDAATRMTLDGSPIEDADEQHWTYYRVVFPVQNQRRAG